MKIHCLGTAGYHPNNDRQTSCYYLPESGIALDGGTGTYRLPAVMQGNSLDILLSHAHLDHTAGLTFLLDVAVAYPLERIRIWGEAEKTGLPSSSYRGRQIRFLSLQRFLRTIRRYRGSL